MSLTVLAMLEGPTAFAEVAIDGGLRAGGLALDRARADIATLAAVLVRHHIVVLHRVQHLGPVQCGQVAQVRVFFHPHSATRDVHQTVQADLLQLEHLKHHQRVVEEKVVATDDGQVGEEVT